MDVGRHLGALLGQRPRLALGDEVPHQAQPPGTEDDDARRDDEDGTADGPQGRHRRVALDQHGHTHRTDEQAHDDAGDEPAATHPVRVRPEQRHDVVVDEGLLGLPGVAPDQDDHADGEECRPSEETDERDVQGAGDELHRDRAAGSGWRRSSGCRGGR